MDRTNTTWKKIHFITSRHVWLGHSVTVWPPQKNLSIKIWMLTDLIIESAIRESGEKRSRWAGTEGWWYTGHFEQCCLGTFPLRMGNKFQSGYFRSVVGPVSHLVVHWWQHFPKLPSVSSAEVPDFLFARLFLLFHGLSEYSILIGWQVLIKFV